MSNAKAIPDGYHTITPYLYFKGADKAIEFYKTALGATEIMRMPGPDGKISHAELRIGDSRIMLGEENPKMGVLSPQSVGGSPVILYMYVPNVDEVHKKAIAGGATAVQPVKDMFYGDRSGSFKDAWGHTWWVATHKEDVAPEELKKRMTAAMGQSAGG